MLLLLALPTNGGDNKLHRPAYRQTEIEQYFQYDLATVRFDSRSRLTAKEGCQFDSH